MLFDQPCLEGHELTNPVPYITLSAGEWSTPKFFWMILTGQGLGGLRGSGGSGFRASGSRASQGLGVTPSNVN